MRASHYFCIFLRKHVELAHFYQCVCVCACLCACMCMFPSKHVLFLCVSDPCVCMCVCLHVCVSEQACTVCTCILSGFECVSDQICTLFDYRWLHGHCRWHVCHHYCADRRNVCIACILASVCMCAHACSFHAMCICTIMLTEESNLSINYCM